MRAAAAPQGEARPQASSLQQASSLPQASSSQQVSSPLQADAQTDAASGPRFERVVRIRFGHCDPAGIVFYPQYFVLFNALIEDWVTDALGISYAGLVAQRRIGLPTVALQTEFRAVSRMGDDVSLGLRVQRLGTRSFTLALDARCAGEERLRCTKTIVATSLDTHRATPVPEDLRAAIERFRGADAR
jgi:4-hydroxybenzoyl-CoA thioesterase